MFLGRMTAYLLVMTNAHTSLINVFNYHTRHAIWKYYDIFPIYGNVDTPCNQYRLI